MAKRKTQKTVIGVDPGLTGAIVHYSGDTFKHWLMPIDDERRVDYDELVKIFKSISKSKGHVFLERAMPMAMGAKHAFNYGRDFKAIEIAIQTTGLPVTYVEPNKWCKVIHQGVDKRLKPKAKSMVAIKRLLPKLYEDVPKSPKAQNPHEGVVDALLIAKYGYDCL